MKLGIIWRLVLVIVFAALFCVFALREKVEARGGYVPEKTQDVKKCEVPFPLPNASEIGSQKFEKLLYAFLEQGCYKNWISDSRIRDTGPFINGVYYGTHPAVKIYYSPGMWEWLNTKNRQGEIPDGEMMIKEMYPPPAKQDSQFTSWTTMVKDKKGAFDGWYWSYHSPGYASANPDIDYPDSGFGLYCLRCHASAEKESTFAAVKNVLGDPISFNIQMPTMKPQPLLDKTDFHEQVANMDVVQVDLDLILCAIDLHRLHALSFWDALIVRAALANGCTVLYSEDLQTGQRLNGLQIVNPFYPAQK